MTKKEQKELDDLKKERDIARALSWPNFPKPTPLERPSHENGKGEIHGWSYNSHREYDWVTEHYQNSTATYNVHRGNRLVGGTRDLYELYATKQEAYLALYHDLCWKYGKTLAKILKLAEMKEGE